MVVSFFGNRHGWFSIVVLDGGISSGSQEQSHAFWLILDDTVMEGCVAFAGLLIKAEAVLHNKVHDMKGMAILVTYRFMQSAFSKFLQRTRESSAMPWKFCEYDYLHLHWMEVGQSGPRRDEWPRRNIWGRRRGYAPRWLPRGRPKSLENLRKRIRQTSSPHTLLWCRLFSQTCRWW